MLYCEHFLVSFPLYYSKLNILGREQRKIFKDVILSFGKNTFDISHYFQTDQTTSSTEKN